MIQRTIDDLVTDLDSRRREDEDHAQALAFLNKALGTEQVALVKGKIDPTRPTLVRMHQLSLFADAFGESGPRSDRSISQ